MEDGNGGYDDHGEHFHQNEAISAVVDEGFLAEEEDDYEDLYNDVNVGEGFLQSLRRNEDMEFKEEEEDEEEDDLKRNDLATPGANAVPAPTTASIPGVIAGEVKAEKESVPLGVTKTFPESGFRGSDNVPGVPSRRTPDRGNRAEMTQLSGRSVDMGNHIISSNILQSPLPPPPPLPLPPPPVATDMRQGVGVSSNANGGGGGGGYAGGPGSGGGGQSAGTGGSGGGTVLFVGELHWWTTDAELEIELSKYGQVKEVKFFDEKASGKSKGYCQVEFCDPAAATACKEGMNGHVFNGRPCVVAFASPYTVRRMGEAQVTKNQAMAQAALQQGRRGMGDASGNGRGNTIASGANYQGADTGRSFGRSGWGRGGAGNRGQMGPMRNRMGVGGRGIMGNGGTGFGQGLASAAPPLLPPQAMMGQGFDPSYGAMGRMSGYSGFPAGPAPPFSGIMPSFPPVGGMGLPGVAPHVNPAFFGRGIAAGGMNMIPATGIEGSAVGMWSDPSMAGWGADDQGGRAGDSSYGEDAASDQQYGEGSHERGGWAHAAREKDRMSERDLAGTTSDRRYRDERDQGWDRGDKDAVLEPDWSERRHRDERDMGWDRDHDRERDRDRERERGRERDRNHDYDRDRHRDDRDRYSDHHRHREREIDHDDEWDRGRSSRTRSKSRISHEEEQRHRSRELDHGKRRRMSSE